MLLAARQGRPSNDRFTRSSHWATDGDEFAFVRQHRHPNLNLLPDLAAMDYPPRAGFFMTFGLGFPAGIWADANGQLRGFGAMRCQDAQKRYRLRHLRDAFSPSGVKRIEKEAVYSSFI